MNRLDTRTGGRKNASRRREPLRPERTARGSRWPFDARTEDLRSAGSAELDRLHCGLETVSAANHPRTAKLLGADVGKAAQKLIEEAGEVALEGVKRDAGGVVRESADLLYHLVVLWRRAGIGPAEVWGEMHRRAELFGIAEKLPKAAGRKPAAPTSDR